MPCCGQARAASRVASSAADSGRGEPRRTTVNFQYTGKTVLTVVGPVSGMQYRFQGHGATLPVDGRDQRAVAAVPHLRRVS
jgi:hypothetical protein